MTVVREITPIKKSLDIKRMIVESNREYIEYYYLRLWLVLWCLTTLSTIFQLAEKTGVDREYHQTAASH